MTRFLYIALFSCSAMLHVQVSCASGPGFSWGHSFGGVSADSADTVVTDVSGNVYITGHADTSLDFDPGPLVHEGGPGNYILKLDPEGSLIWFNMLPIGADIEDMVIDGDSNVVIAGTFRRAGAYDLGGGNIVTNNASPGMFVLKLDEDGVFAWARGFTTEAAAIGVDGANEIYVFGEFASSADLGSEANPIVLNSDSLANCFVLKLDAVGNSIWATYIEGDIWIVATEIAVGAGGSFILLGEFTTTIDFEPGVGVVELDANGTSSFIAKMSADGQLLWAGRLPDEGSAVTMDNQGAVYVTGAFSFTQDFDPGPSTVSLTAVGNPDAFLLKLDSNGLYQWAKRIGGGGGGVDGGHAVAIGEGESVYLTGVFQGVVSFDSSNPLATGTAVGPYTDIMIAKYSTSGAFLWAQTAGGYNYDFANSIAVLGGALHVVGNFYGQPDLDPSGDSFPCWSAGGGDFYAIKLDEDIVGPNAVSIATDFSGPLDVDRVRFIVEFDEEVAGFNDGADLVLVHGGTSHTSVRFSGGPRIYSVAIEGISGEGFFTLAINTGSDVLDLAGNELNSSFISAPVHIEGTAPPLPMRPWPIFLLLISLGIHVIRRRGSANSRIAA